MPIYDSAYVYISTAKSLKDRVVKINQVLDALHDTMLKAATNDNIQEYSLNDGQTVIRTVYRGIDQIQNSIMGLERIKQMYMNQLNGRVVRLVDGKNFKTGY
jgi:hypothetical protein